MYNIKILFSHLEKKEKGYDITQLFDSSILYFKTINSQVEDCFGSSSYVISSFIHSFIYPFFYFSFIFSFIRAPVEDCFSSSLRVISSFIYSLFFILSFSHSFAFHSFSFLLLQVHTSHTSNACGSFRKFPTT